MDERDERAKRASARRAWIGRVGRVADLPDAELVEGSPGELIGLVRELTLAAWAMRGEPLPDYDRRDAPGRVLLRRTDAP